MAVRNIIRTLLSFPFYRYVIRPFLFLLPPESAQTVAISTLKIRPLWSLHSMVTGVSANRLLVPMGGLSALNPIGLAAGFDKNLEYLRSLAGMGFGYLVCGTVTLEPRRGNPKPRLLRNVKQNSLVNSLGFPGQGLSSAVKKLNSYNQSETATPVIVSIAALNEQDTIHCFETLQPISSAIELNISSPNTAGVKEYQVSQRLKVLLDKLNISRNKPLFVKLPAWFGNDSLEEVLSLVRVCKEAGVTGVTAFNTLPIESNLLEVGKGGLSGKPLFQDMLNSLPAIRSELGSDSVINACGGISSSSDVINALNAGANSVQIYTSLIYEGPGLVNSILYRLNNYLKEGENEWRSN
ncbi:MAG: hypothetical protein CL889_04515 [Dehalococcoidia bacterium]|nr:hypothetical protein [Dehalococcoidia bacterium]